MKPSHTALAVMVLSALSGSGAWADVSDEIKALRKPIPYREASMIEGAVKSNGVVVAAIYADTKTQKRMFARKLENEGYYPVLVRVTNDSDQRLLIKANDTALAGKKDSAKAEKIHYVFEGLIKTGGTARALGSIMSFGVSNLVGGNEAVMIVLDGDHNEPLVLNMYNKTLKLSIVEPGDTIAGFVFFDKKASKGKSKTLQLSMQYLNTLDTFAIEAPVLEP